jgi:hypothetical protein
MATRKRTGAARGARGGRSKPTGGTRGKGAASRKSAARKGGRATAGGATAGGATRARRLRALLALAPASPWVERREEMLLALNASKPVEPDEGTSRRRRGPARKGGTSGRASTRKGR